MAYSKRKTGSKKKNKKNIIHFRSCAYNDYIAARMLIGNGLLLQGCQLANTSIEKYFKSFLEFRGNSLRGHKTSGKMLKSVFNFDKELGQRINESFINMLSKSYETRYINSLPGGYNICIPQVKILAELDYTVDLLRRKMDIKQDGKSIETRYEVDIKNKRSELYASNYILQGTNRSDFISQRSRVYELSVDKYRELLEIEYVTESVVDDGEFMKDTLVTVDGMSYRLSYKPISE